MKTNKLMIIGTIVLSFFSCSLFSRYNTVNDEFKHTITHTYSQVLYSNDNDFRFTTAKLIYERKVGQNQEELNIYFTLNRDINSYLIDSKAFVKANYQVYEITLFDLSSEFRTKNESSTTSNTLKESVRDTTKVRTETKTETKNYDWYDDRFVIRCTPEMINSIRQTNELIFRFYSGPELLTYKLTGSTLKNVQKLFDL